MATRHLEFETSVGLQKFTDTFIAVLELDNVYQRPEPVENPIIIRGFLHGNPTMHVPNSMFMAPDLVWEKGAIDLRNDHIELPEGWDDLMREALRPPVRFKRARRFFDKLLSSFPQLTPEQSHEVSRTWFPPF